jgi:hypothetical protein
MHIGFWVGKRQLGKPKRRWVGNVKMDLREIGGVGVDWIDLAQDRDQRRVFYKQSYEVSGSIKRQEILE